MESVKLQFVSPRVLPQSGKLTGRVAILDVAFVADELGTSFEGTTRKLIDELGPRLAVWVDHHDHERHRDYARDPRFVLCKKSEHGACPEMITEELVARIGPVDTIVCHLDLDGLYAAAKWLRGGTEPYPGADDDARAIDTRLGTPGPIAVRIDHALRAHFRDDGLKQCIVHYVATGARDPVLRQRIDQAAADFEVMERETQRLASLYERRGQAVFVDAQLHARTSFDKTELLLAGQALAQVSIVRHAGYVTLAAAFDSGIDFLKLFGISGGMPTRVTLPEKRLADVLAKFAADSQISAVDP